MDINVFKWYMMINNFEDIEKYNLVLGMHIYNL